MHVRSPKAMKFNVQTLNSEDCMPTRHSSTVHQSGQFACSWNLRVWGATLKPNNLRAQNLTLEVR